MIVQGSLHPLLQVVLIIACLPRTTAAPHNTDSFAACLSEQYIASRFLRPLTKRLGVSPALCRFQTPFRPPMLGTAA